MSNNEIIYALWYYTKDGEKSTNAISKDPEILNKLHTNDSFNPNSYYHTYKKLINRITVEPIQCFILLGNSLIELNNDNWNMIESINNGAFYACYNTINNQIYDDLILEEILIYLSKEDHETWRKLYIENKDNNLNEEKTYPSFFYTETISNNSVNLDYYYEEGIMNA
jgi:hypothetical protein